MEAISSNESLFTLLIIAAVVLLVVGLAKRVVWLCTMSAVLGLALFLSNPTVGAEISSAVSSFFGGAVDPMKDNDYSDMVGDAIDSPNKGLGGIGKD